jgi:hypothetical protein
MRPAIADRNFDHHDRASAAPPRAFTPLRDRLAGPPLPTPVPAPPPAASKLRPAILYGLLGFVLGALFWHFVGFWDFVGQIMFKGSQQSAEIAAPPPAIKLKDRVTAAAPLAVTLEPETCTTLALDRDNGTTTLAACDVQTLPLRSLKAARKEDRWVTSEQRVQQATARGWSSRKVEAPTGRLDQASAD